MFVFNQSTQNIHALYTLYLLFIQKVVDIDEEEPSYFSQKLNSKPIYYITT